MVNVLRVRQLAFGAAHACVHQHMVIKHSDEQLL